MSEPNNTNTQPEEEEQPRRAGSNKAKEHIKEHTAVRAIKEGQDEQLIR